MTAEFFLSFSITAALAMLLFAMALIAIRVVIGPTLGDRALALDQLVAVVIGFIAVFAIRTGFGLYIDIALALGLVGFLTTAAFARYLFVAGDPEGHRRAAKQHETEEKGK
jgi:multicomponent Na+:H+ antiporter subunit F